jgi:hypothetical protein
MSTNEEEAKKYEAIKSNEETASISNNNNDLSNKPFNFQTYHQVKREASHR